jgi:HD-GYP domain-containing protein (c-di-GMP phosphodiesterase class II)
MYIALHNYTKALATALCYRDRLTRIHSDRVCDVAGAVGMACGLSSTDLGMLTIAASFHDLGKIGTPDRILLKEALLDESEWAIMQRHSEIGQQIVAATGIEGSEEAASAIRHHHEHFDGQGYPDGLAGEDIPVCSRIISIADGYDAMAVTRSYRHARTHAEVMAVLHEETGGKYDPDLMRVFSRLIESSELRAPDR